MLCMWIPYDKDVLLHLNITYDKDVFIVSELVPKSNSWFEDALHNMDWEN